MGLVCRICGSGSTWRGMAASGTNRGEQMAFGLSGEV